MLLSSLGQYWDMATIRDKVGHLETLPIDLLNAHLDASFIFNHLDTMNGGPNFSPGRTCGSGERSRAAIGRVIRWTRRSSPATPGLSPRSCGQSPIALSL